MNRLTEALADFRTYLVLFGVAVIVFGYVNLPKKVEVLEVKTEENEDDIKDVAATFDSYMMRQTVIEEQANKREELMLELIKEK